MTAGNGPGDATDALIDWVSGLSLDDLDTLKGWLEREKPGTPETFAAQAYFVRRKPAGQTADEGDDEPDMADGLERVGSGEWDMDHFCQQVLGEWYERAAQ